MTPPFESRWSRVNWLGVGTIFLLVLLWQLYKEVLASGLDSIASPGEILGAVRELVAGGPLMSEVAHTLWVAIMAWVLAVGGGVVLGTLLGVSRRGRMFSLTSIDVLRSIPSIAFVPIALLIFGFSVRTEMLIGVYVALWPVLLNTLDGVMSVPASLRETARTLRLPRSRVLFSIVLPAALPSILVGLRLALALSVALIVVAEMLGNPAGLGYGLVYAQQAFHPQDVFAYVLVIGILGWLLNAVFVASTRALFRGHEGL